MQRWRVRLVSPESPTRVRWLEDAYIRIEGSQVAAVEPYEGQVVDRDLRPAVLLPGFVDSHVHAAQTRIVGRATGTLLEWLDQSVFPEEARLADAQVARDVARAFCSRVAAAGTTLVVALGSVHRGFSEALLQEMSECGLQGFVAPAWMDEASPAALSRPAAESADDVEYLLQRWHGHDGGRLQVAVYPRFALSCSVSALARAGALARANDLLVTTHLAETLAEVTEVRRRFGTPDYLAVYEAADLVGQRSVLAHCVQLDASEWDRLAAAGSVVAHCPDSNDFLGSGSMPLPEVLRRNIPLTVGSDVAAGRSFRIPRHLSGVRDHALRNGVSPSMAELLWWGTRGAAQSLGFSRSGALEAGWFADLCLLPGPSAEVASVDDLLGRLWFDHDQPPALETWVRGRRVWPRP